MTINVTHEASTSYLPARLKRTGEYNGTKFSYYAVVINGPVDSGKDFERSVLGNQSPASYQKKHKIAWNE